jgi:hypothetical protein
MLTACFDAAGKDSSGQMLVVAGFASFAGAWNEFEERWRHRLEQDSLMFFHAGDFAHSVNAFEGWKGDEPRRRALAGDLIGIIQATGLRKFGRILQRDDISHIRNLAKDYGVQLDGFTVAAMETVHDFHAYAKSEGVNRDVRCVFEKGDPERGLRELFDQYGLASPFFEWSKPHSDRKGFRHGGFIGLQAAGWLAYEYYLDARRLLGGPQPSDRWAFRAFESIPGHLQLMHRGVE